MTEFSEAAWLWAAKGAGAVAGSAISLAYILPASRREAGIRFAVGLACGLVFGGAAGVKIAQELGIADAIGAAETMLVGAAAASLTAWWAVGLVIRMLRREQGRAGAGAGSREREAGDDR
jgi:undecaprenyl pyrophosphate phosphatase UppP